MITETIPMPIKQIEALAAGTLLLLSLSLGGCATASSSPMDARAEATPPPKTSSYPPVQDLPTQREKPAMTTDEQSKLQRELIAARDRQIATGKAQGAPLAPFKP